MIEIIVIALAAVIILLVVALAATFGFETIDKPFQTNFGKSVINALKTERTEHDKQKKT